MRYFIILISALFITLSSTASTDSRRHSADSLRNELKKIKSTTDSIDILCNLYDVLPRTESTAIGDTLCVTALRAGDERTALDIIRNQANRRMRNKEGLDKLTELTMSCSAGNDRKETLTFIRMMDNIRCARYSNIEERNKALQTYLKKAENTSDADIYDHIALTHGICMLLSDDPNGDILVAYMDTLGNLIKNLPPNAYSIRNTYNVHKASIFASAHPDRSIQADMNVLKDVSSLEKYYLDNGRVFRNYHPTYYTIYTRLLSNFAALDSAQVEEYYAKAMEQIDMDYAIRETYEKAPMPDIYYAMYHKDYGKALPLLRKVIDESYVQPRRLQMLRYIIECSEALGLKEPLLETYRQYTAALHDDIKERTSKSFRELQTAYAIYEMKHHFGAIEIERQESIARMQRIFIAIASAAIIVLIILVIFISKQYKKNKLMAQNLVETNRQLVEESENLRRSKAELIRARDLAQKANNLKSDFIKNMSYEVKVPLQAINEYSHLIADCASNSSQHMTRFADLLELNSELLSTIVNDVLRLSEIESSSLPLQPQVVHLKALCDATIEGVKHRIKPGVELKLDPNVRKIDLFVDPARLQQILNNLLTNAAKFTPEGSITLSYGPDDDNKNVIFSVTDTGIGINPENKERIFDRFVKLDRDTQGAGLGLTISRLLAEHLGGKLWLDTSYTGGARFCLSLPKKYESE